MWPEPVRVDCYVVVECRVDHQSEKCGMAPVEVMVHSLYFMYRKNILQTRKGINLISFVSLLVSEL